MVMPPAWSHPRAGTVTPPRGAWPMKSNTYQSLYSQTIVQIIEQEGAPLLAIRAIDNMATNQGVVGFESCQPHQKQETDQRFSLTCRWRCPVELPGRQ